ncbi:MAG: tautomerase family protein [Olsenella sp.]|nr:tautomerase family protein [Olsenella sp.]
MPVITFETSPISKEQKRKVVEGFTKVASESTGIPEGAFYVFIKENESDNVGVGGRLLSDKK